MNDNFNFFTHKIANPAGNDIKWDEYLEKLANGTAKPDEDEVQEARGQVINNDNEEGVSNDPGKDPKAGKVTDNSKEAAVDCKECKCDPCECKKEASGKPTDKKADCGKDMGECDDAGKITDKAKPAGSAEPQVEQDINNDPNYQDGESNDGVKKEDAKAKSNANIKAAAGTGKFQKVASMNRQEKVNLMGYMLASKKYPIAYVEALVNEKYANLTDEEKGFLKDYWSILEPETYATEMVEDR